MWIDIKKEKPEPFIEVLVEVDGHRDANWRNNHNLVAYMNKCGEFYEERHRSDTPLNVTHWMALPKPPSAQQTCMNNILENLTRDDLIKVIAEMHDTIQDWGNGWGLTSADASKLIDIGSACISHCANTNSMR